MVSACNEKNDDLVILTPVFIAELISQMILGYCHIIVQRQYLTYLSYVSQEFENMLHVVIHRPHMLFLSISITCVVKNITCLILNACKIKPRLTLLRVLYDMLINPTFVL